jgi:hypothetical protein
VAKPRAKSESQVRERGPIGETDKLWVLFQKLSQACMGNHEGRGKALRLAVDPVRLEALGFEDRAHPIVHHGDFHGALEQIFVDAPWQRAGTVKKWRRHLHARQAWHARSGIEFPMPQGYVSQLMQQPRGQQMRMLFEEIRVLVIGMDGASAEIMLGHDAHPFGFADVLPAIGEVQVTFEKTFKCFDLHGEAITSLV